MAKQPENNKTASFGDKFIAFANKVSDVSGLVAAYLLVPLVIVFLIECISRNLFNSPTTWAYGMCFIIGGCAAVLGFGYAMKSGAMVRIDAFSSKLPEKAHCILDLVLYAVLFLPLTIGGTIECAKNAITATATLETLSTDLADQDRNDDQPYYPYASGACRDSEPHPAPARNERGER